MKRQTSSWPARLTFSFLKTEVSKSSETGDLVIIGAATIRAPSAEPEMTLEGSTCDWSDLKEVLEDRNVVVNPKVLTAVLMAADDVEEAAVVGATEKVVAAAAIIDCFFMKKWKERVARMNSYIFVALQFDFNFSSFTSIIRLSPNIFTFIFIFIFYYWNFPLHYSSFFIKLSI